MFAPKRLRPAPDEEKTLAISSIKMNRAHLFALYMLADNFFSIQWKLQAQKRPHNNCYCSVARETLEPGLAGAVHPIRAPGPPPQHLPFRATCLSPRCWRIAQLFSTTASKVTPQGTQTHPTAWNWQPTVGESWAGDSRRKVLEPHRA